MTVFAVGDAGVAVFETVEFFFQPLQPVAITQPRYFTPAASHQFVVFVFLRGAGEDYAGFGTLGELTAGVDFGFKGIEKFLTCRWCIQSQIYSIEEFVLETIIVHEPYRLFLIVVCYFLLHQIRPHHPRHKDHRNNAIGYLVANGDAVVRRREISRIFDVTVLVDDGGEDAFDGGHGCGVRKINYCPRRVNRRNMSTNRLFCVAVAPCASVAPLITPASLARSTGWVAMAC